MQGGKTTSLDSMEQKLQQRTLISKIKGCNDYLASLLQKKIRIDLEIKRTKARLTKLKQKSKTEVKLSAQMETGLDPEITQKSVYLSLWSDQQEGTITRLLREQVALAEQLLQEVDSIEAYLLTEDSFPN